MKSILQSDTTKCYFCGTTEGLQKHHVFGASNRAKSEEDGLWIMCCWQDHLTTGLPSSIHNNPNNGKDMTLKLRAEYAWLKYYNLSETDFRLRYGKNYL